MTSDTGQFAQAADPFTVVLIASFPPPSIGREFDASDVNDPLRAGRVDPADLGTQHWLWESAVRSLLNTVFARGGTVVTTLDDEFVTLVWGIAQKYAPPVAAEHGEFPGDPVVYAVTDSQDAFNNAIRSEREGGAGRINGESWFTLLEGTGLVEARLLEPDFVELPGPGPRFGVSLRPVELTELEGQLLSAAEQVTFVQWPGQYTDGNSWPNASAVEMEGDAPPLHYHLESLVDSWTNRGRRPQF